MGLNVGAAGLSGDVTSSLETANRRSGVSGHARASHSFIKRGAAAADSEITKTALLHFSSVPVQALRHDHFRCGLVKRKGWNEQ